MNKTEAWNALGSALAGSTIAEGNELGAMIATAKALDSEGAYDTTNDTEAIYNLGIAYGNSVKETVLFDGEVKTTSSGGYYSKDITLLVQFSYSQSLPNDGLPSVIHVTHEGTTYEAAYNSDTEMYGDAAYTEFPFYLAFNASGAKWTGIWYTTAAAGTYDVTITADIGVI